MSQSSAKHSYLINQLSVCNVQQNINLNLQILYLSSMTDETTPKHTEMDKQKPEINTKDSNWGWFSVWSPKQGSTRISSRNASSRQSVDNNLEFEVVQQETTSKSYTASHDHMLLENNFQINDQYVNLNEHGTSYPVIPIDDDHKDHNKNTIATNNTAVKDHELEDQTQDEEAEPIEDVNADKTANDDSEAVIISQTLTLRTRNEELQQERDELRSETLQLRMQTQCLQQTNDHIIAVQSIYIFHFHFHFAPFICHKTLIFMHVYLTLF